jgi:hypothetical protein
MALAQRKILKRDDRRLGIVALEPTDDRSRRSLLVAEAKISASESSWIGVGLSA